jgi:hypothetical protein
MVRASDIVQRGERRIRRRHYWIRYADSMTSGWSPRMILTFSERPSVCHRIYMGQDTRGMSATGHNGRAGSHQILLKVDRPCRREAVTSHFDPQRTSEHIPPLLEAIHHARGRPQRSYLPRLWLRGDSTISAAAFCNSPRLSRTMSSNCRAAFAQIMLITPCTRPPSNSGTAIPASPSGV